MYDKLYAGWYAVRDESYYDVSELVEGSDGTRRAPSGAEVEWVEEPSIFFRLSKYRDALLSHYDAHPDFILPRTRMNEVRAFVEGDLWDLCVSRTTFSLGSSSSRSFQPCDVCLGRGIDELFDWAWLSRFVF